MLQDQIDGVSDTFATANAAFASTPMIILDQNGTPIPQIEELFTEMDFFFGLVKGVNNDWAGPFAPLVLLSITSMLVIMTVKTLTFLLPFIAAIFGFIRKIIILILEFIPG